MTKENFGFLKRSLIYCDKHPTFKPHGTVLTLQMPVTFIQIAIYAERIEFNRHSFALKIIPVPKRKKSVVFTANIKWSEACLCYVQYLYVKTSQGIAGQNLSVVKLATLLQRNFSRTLSICTFLYGLESVILFRK